MRAPLLFGVAAFALWMASRQRGTHSDALNPSVEIIVESWHPPTWSDEFAGAIFEAGNRIMGTSASSMTVSPEMVQRLKLRERLMLTRYELGDGGWTIGYGHFTPYSAVPPPERITVEEAEAIFDDDIEQRSMRWVRAYVTAPLTQSQFDALTSMAFNLSPRSFKTIADAVNRGEDPESAALQFVRAGTNLENGLRNRRAEELAWYRREGIADIGGHYG